MNNNDILGRRQSAQMMDGAVTDPAAIVARLGAVQSQDYAGAAWALSLRTGANLAAIDKAFDDGHILRTHVLRPTWHFVAPADIRWMLALTGPRIAAGNASRYRTLDLAAPTRAKTRDIIGSALAGGKSLTRNQLAAVLQENGIDTKRGDNRLAHIMMDAELEGLIASGPQQGKQQTYALLDERAPKSTSLDRDQAVTELVRRYFTSHGPATVRDFAWWSGLTAADAKAGLAELGSELETATIEGKDYWFAPGDPTTQPSALLLPNYDEYTVAYRDRSHIFDLAHAVHLDSRANPLFQNVLVIGGSVAGTWSRAFKKDSVAVTIKPFKSLNRSQLTAVKRAAQQFADFLGLELSLTV